MSLEIKAPAGTGRGSDSPLLCKQQCGPASPHATGRNTNFWGTFYAFRSVYGRLPKFRKLESGQAFAIDRQGSPRARGNMSIAIEMLLHSHKRTIDYGGRLTADLSHTQAVVQPGPGMNHPAWVLCHLNIYLPVMTALIRGEDFEDPKDHKFGMQSKPEADESLYPNIDELRAVFLEGNQAAADALRRAGPACLDQDMTLERWKPLMPKAGTALTYLMLAHQNLHLGQVSAWRRVQGLPSV